MKFKNLIYQILVAVFIAGLLILVNVLPPGPLASKITKSFSSYINSIEKRIKKSQIPHKYQ